MAAIPFSTQEFRVTLRDRFDALLQSPRARAVAVLLGGIAFGLLWGVAVAYAAVGATLLALTLIAGLLCMRDFRVGVALLIVIMPISSSTVFPHSMFGLTGLNPLNLLLVATFTMFLMRASGTDAIRGWVPRPLWWQYILPLSVAAVVGAPHVMEIPQSFRASEMIYFDTPFGYVRDMLLKPLALVIYALLVGAAVAWSKKPERFVIPMLISVFVMAGMAIIFVATSGASLSSLAGEYSRHFLSTLGLHANDLGRLYAVAFALLLFVWDRTRRIGLKTLLVISMVTVVVALLLTFSRGAFFGFVIVCALYLVLRRSMKTFAIAALVVPFAIMFMPGAFWYRLQMGFDSGLNEITAGRYEEIWLPLIPEVLRTMPWGGGLGSVMWAKAMLLGEMFAVGHPHNAYIQLYMDLGIVGTVLVLMFWLQSLRGFWKLGRDERLIPEMQGFFEGAAVGLVSFLVAGIAGSSLEPSPEQGYLWLALGMMWGVRKHLAKIPKAVKAPKPSRSTNLTPYPLGAGEI